MSERQRKRQVIDAAMERRKMSPRALGEAVGVSARNVQRWLTGKQGIADVHLDSVRDALRMTPLAYYRAMARLAESEAKAKAKAKAKAVSSHS